MNFKKTSLLLMLCAVLLFISACSGSDNSSNQNQNQNDNGASSDDIITLEIMTYSAESYIPLVDEYFVKAFEDRHPNIKIKVNEVGNPTEVMRAQLAASAGPDIILAALTENLEYGRAGYLLELNKYIDQYGWDELYQEWAYETGKLGDTLYGLPGSYEALVVWYNKTMFEEHGWQVPNNYEEFLALCADIAETGIMPIAYGVSDFKPANEWMLSIIYNAALGEENMRKLLSNEISWTDEMVSDATQKWVDIWQNGYVTDKQSFAISLDEAWDLFVSEQAAIKPEGTWAVDAFLGEDDISFEYDYFVMPPWSDNNDTALPLANGLSLAVNANTAHPDEAVKYLNWLAGEELALIRLEKEGVVAAIRDLDVTAVEVDQLVIDVINKIDSYAERGLTGYASWTFWGPNVRNYMIDQIDAVYLNQMTVQEFLEGAQRAAEQDEEEGLLFEFE